MHFKIFFFWSVLKNSFNEYSNILIYWFWNKHLIRQISTITVNSTKYENSMTMNMNMTWLKQICTVGAIVHTGLIPGNMHIVHVLLYGLVLANFYPHSTGLLPWHWGNHMIALVPVKQPCWIWVNVSHKSPVSNDIITTEQITKTV